MAPVTLKGRTIHEAAGRATALLQQEFGAIFLYHKVMEKAVITPSEGTYTVR